MLRPSFKLLGRNWWPVAVWLVVIRLESTDFASSRNTFDLLAGVCRLIFGRVDPQFIFLMNAILRKTGHFLGYAILSALTFLALKYTHRDRLRPLLQRSWGTFFRDLWQFDWMVISILLPLITASLDEMHQAFLPSRTGRWEDVALDTSGALVVQALIYARSVYSMSRRRRDS